MSSSRAGSKLSAVSKLSEATTKYSEESASNDIKKRRQLFSEDPPKPSKTVSYEDEVVEESTKIYPNSDKQEPSSFQYMRGQKIEEGDEAFQKELGNLKFKDREFRSSWDVSGLSSDSENSAPAPLVDRAHTPDGKDTWLTGQTKVAKHDSSTRDITLHFELSIEVDLDERLEEVARLRRFGHFTKAEQFFRDSLMAHIQNPRVAVEYADLLLDKGAIQHVRELVENEVVVIPIQTRPNYTACIADLYWLIFQLIVNRANIAYQGSLFDSLSFIRENRASLAALKARVSADFRLEFESMEVQLYKHLFHIRAQIGCASNFIDDLQLFVDGPVSQTLYCNLLAQGQIWDFRDIFCASLYLNGPETTWHKFFGKACRQPDCLDRLIEDWSLDECDESSHLAILDILMTLVEGSSRVSYEYFPKVEWCLKHARKLVEDMTTLNPETLSSRPYFRWINNEERYKRITLSDIASIATPSTTNNFQYLDDFAGICILTGGIPLYIPAASENPGWKPPELEGISNESLTSVMKLAEENGDSRIQVQCLDELICRSATPNKMIHELLELLEKKMGDNISYLYLNLSRYILAVDETSRTELYATLCNRRNVSYRANPLLGWCRAVIEDALARSLNRPATRLHEIDISNDLPIGVRDLISNSKLQKYLIPSTGTQNRPRAPPTTRYEITPYGRPHHVV
ncbi:hypothetical protein ACMFMF_006644 [Clarireedia jacksonii]